MPAIIRSSEVLPEPLWPTRPTRSPARMSRLMSLSAWTTVTFLLADAILPPVAEAITAPFSDRLMVP